MDGRNHRGHRYHHNHQHLHLTIASGTHSLNPPIASPLSPFTFSPNSGVASTPSKRRSLPASPHSSLSSFLLLLFSLRSLYSLLPFIRSTPPSFSLFPFSFIVSSLSLILHLFSFSLPSSEPLSLKTLTLTLTVTPLAAKSALLALVFLLRFQAVRYCGTAATILADFAGSLFARSVQYCRTATLRKANFLRGLIFLAAAIVLLSLSWDRVGCYPLSYSPTPPEGCARIWPMILPFLSGFLAYFEKASINWTALRHLGRKRTRLATLAMTTLILSVPALAIYLFSNDGETNAAVSFKSMSWPLINTVIFGVVLTENFGAEKLVPRPKELRRDFSVMFFCTLILELFYFPKLSLSGFLFCGFLLWLSVMQLSASSLDYVELGTSYSSESLKSIVIDPVRHILSERKSRKIALFLLINTLYMVVEFVFGFMSNSLGLISDACHMLFDCAALAIGLYASYISRRPANRQFNYGRGRFEVLSGYVNAIFLVLVGALIVLESIERILDPREINTNSLLVVSIGGLAVNIVGLIFFHEEHHHAHGGSVGCSHSHSHHEHDSSKHDKHDNFHDHRGHQNHKNNVHGNCNHHKHDDRYDHHKRHNHGVLDHESVSMSEHEHLLLNEKEIDPIHHNSDSKTQNCAQKHHHHHIDHNMEGIFLHVLADTMGSVGVVVSTLLIKYKGWLVADPACSIFISVMIVVSVLPLLRNSAEILLQRFPRAQERSLRSSFTDLMKVKGVIGIQNLHVWSLTNTDIVATVHLHVSAETDKDSMEARVVEIFHEAGIKDIAVEVERLQL